MEQLFRDTLDDYTVVTYICSALDNIDRNFLSKNDLEEIQSLALDLGFENLPRGDEIEGLYNWQDEVDEIYEIWRDLFEKKGEALKKDLISMFVTGENISIIKEEELVLKNG